MIAIRDEPRKWDMAQGLWRRWVRARRCRGFAGLMRRIDLRAGGGRFFWVGFLKADLIAISDEHRE